MRARTWMAAGACGLVVIALLLIAGSLTVAGATQQPQPKTVFQCQRKFKASAQQKERAACIKRVKSEKPGTSCAHPLFSGQSLGGPTGDTKDYSVKFKVLGHPNLEFVVPITREIEVVVHNPHIRICSAEAKDSGHNPDNGRFERSRKRTYHVTISPNGGLSSPFTVSSDAFVVAVAYARLVS